MTATHDIVIIIIFTWSASIHCFSAEMKQQPKVFRYLKELGTEKLLELGGELGLDPIELESIPSRELARRLCIGWIQERHYVKESGTPTWRSLTKALRLVGENGVADRIEEDFNFTL